MVRDGTGIAVVPVGDPGERLARGQIDAVGAAAQLLGGEIDPPAERLTHLGQSAGIDRLRLPEGRQESPRLQPFVQGRPPAPAIPSFNQSLRFILVLMFAPLFSKVFR